MVVRIPIAALPARPPRATTGCSCSASPAGSEHGEAVSALLEAHRYTRGLDLLPPGTATNVTDDAPEAAGRLDVQALFDSEFDRPAAAAQAPGRSAGGRRRPPHRARAVALALGLAGDTALDRTAGRGRRRARAGARGEPGALAGDLGLVVLRPDELGERRLAAPRRGRPGVAPELVHRLRARRGPAPDAPRRPAPLRDPPGLDVRAAARAAPSSTTSRTRCSTSSPTGRTTRRRAAARSGRLGRGAGRARRGAGVRRRRDLRRDAAHPRAAPASRRRHAPRAERPLLAAARPGRAAVRARPDGRRHLRDRGGARDPPLVRGVPRARGRPSGRARRAGAGRRAGGRCRGARRGDLGNDAAGGGGARDPRLHRPLRADARRRDVRDRRPARDRGAASRAGSRTRSRISGSSAPATSSEPPRRRGSTRPATARRARRFRSACWSRPGTDEDSVAELAGWLGDAPRRRRRLDHRRRRRPRTSSTTPYPLLRQLLQVSAATVGEGNRGDRAARRARPPARPRRRRGSGRDPRARAPAPRHARPGDLPASTRG